MNPYLVVVPTFITPEGVTLNSTPSALGSFRLVAWLNSVMYHRDLDHVFHPHTEVFNEMKIALASDHAGFAEKERLKPLLIELGLDVDDLGTTSEDSVDYPDYARAVADAVADGDAEQGILVCGSGTGMAITANKVPGIRAAVAWSEETARLARQHNDANVLAIGAHTTPPGEIPNIVRAWFGQEFDGGRHAGRVDKIRIIENSHRREKEKR